MNNWEGDIIEEFCERFCVGCDEPNVKCAISKEFLKWMKEEIKEFAEELLILTTLSDKIHPDENDILEALKDRGIKCIKY